MQFGDTPLMQAVRGRRTESVQLLLAEKTLQIDKLNNRGETALSLAIVENEFEICRLLLTGGADCNVLNQVCHR